MDKTQKKDLIQIVDDVPENLQVLGKVLARNGYRVAVSTNGQQALDALDDILPDLILLDVMMPGMDGIEVCRRIKQNKKTQHIPVLFISAQSESRQKVKGFEAGASDYIGKPFDTVEVLARVKTHLELKKAMQTIRMQNEHLEELVDARTHDLIQAERRAAFSLFSQGIVHNLKSPLTAIMGGVQLLEYQKDQIMADGIENIPEPYSAFMALGLKYLSIFKEASQKLNDMIQSLMVKFRDDNSQTIEKVDINGLLKKEFNFLTADSRFKYKTQKSILLAEEALYTSVIPGELNQIIENIVQNALDAMFKQENQQLVFKSGKDGNMVWFSIADNGPGMDNETKEKIFDAFYTTKPAQATEPGVPVGTGLGLFMCRQIIEKYSGRLEVESAPGKGTTFKIILPAAG